MNTVYYKNSFQRYNTTGSYLKNIVPVFNLTFRELHYSKGVKVLIDKCVSCVSCRICAILRRILCNFHHKTEKIC